MPIYDYVCSGCGHRFEVVHGLNENGPARCPECGGSVSRAFAPPTIVFKGSGWARTDRRASTTPRKSPTTRSEEGASHSEEPGATRADGSSPTGPAQAEAPATDSGASSTGTADSKAADSGSSDS